MAEEVEKESNGKSFKNIIIGLVSTVTLGVGGFITNKLTGGGEEKGTATQTAQPVINITNSNAQQAAAGKTVIIKEKAPADKDVQKAQNSEKPKPKKDGDEFKEKPAQW
jgi:hypothetical protein